MHPDFARRAALFAAVAALAALAGCAAAPPAEPPLALVVVPEPERLGVYMQGHPDERASLDRALAFTAQMRAGEGELIEALQPHAFRPGALIEEALTAALSRAGRAAVRVPSPMVEREEFLREYPLPAGAGKRGRYLDVYPVKVGFWNVWPAGAWQPWVVLKWRLYDGETRRELAGGIVNGGIGIGPAPGGETIATVPPPDVSFRTWSVVRENPPAVMAAIRAAIDRVAAAIVAQALAVR